MSTSTFNHSIATSFQAQTAKPSLISNFVSWCESQETSRYLWLGLGVAGHGCVITPITIAVIVFAGLNFTLFMLAIAAMTVVLITNLAAMPTKVIIPVFLISLLVDILIIAVSIFSGLSLSNGF